MEGKEMTTETVEREKERERKAIEKGLEDQAVRFARLNGWMVLPKFETTAGIGVPDRLFQKKGRSVYVEFKTKNTGVLSEAQKIWSEKIKNNNFEWYVCDDFERFVEILDGKTDATSESY